MATRSLARSVAIGAAVLVVSACASTGDKPVKQLARAEASIEQAENADARKYGVVELDAARKQYEEAQDAVKAGDMVRAQRLAHQAELDAELAAAKARTRKTQKAADELEKSIRTLHDEIQRSQ
mgnify:CR=1 FL=1